jgi:hypothetical protein
MRRKISWTDVRTDGQTDRGKTVYPSPPSWSGGIITRKRQYTHWTYMHIFRHIFLSNYWWQKSDIWSQAPYRYPISWESFLDPSDSYLLFVNFVDFYTHLTYICICTFFVAFFLATIDDMNLIFGHKLHKGMPYCGKHFWTRVGKQEVRIW